MRQVFVCGAFDDIRSRHLRFLRDRGMVSTDRQSQNIYYTLADQRVIQALDLLRAVLANKLINQAALVETVKNLE